MKIRELNLISFGKFKNTIFNLEDGLNIFYGENEWGKTTIHNFIEGMYYGFQKPNVSTRRSFFEEKKKYTPWHEDKYAGILILEKDNKIYRIERDFKEDKVKVYDDLTGKDITSFIDTGERVKTYLPGLYFFGFNCLVYRNTVSIRQLENRVDDNLAKEVKDKLINMTTALDDDISVKNAIKELDDKLGQIGTERAYKQPFAMTQKKLDELKKRRKEALEKKKEYEILYEDFIILKEAIEKKKEEVKELNKLLDKASMVKIKETYEEALNIQRNIEDIDNRIEELEPYSNISEEDYHNSLKIQGELMALKGEIMSISENINSINNRLKGLNSRINGEKEGHLKEIYQDYSKFNELEEEKNQLLMNNEENRIEILNSELKQANEKSKKAKIQGIIFSAVTIVSLALIYINSLFSIGAFISGILVLYSIVSDKNIKKQAISLNNNIEELKSREEERKRKIDHITEYQENIIKKYNLLSKSEFFMLYEETRFAQASRNDFLKQIDELVIERNNLKTKLEEKIIKRKDMEDKLKGLLKKNGLEKLNEFKEALDKKINYDKLLREKENKIELFKRVLGNTTIEELESKAMEIEEEIILDRDIDEITEDLKNKEETLLQLNSQYSKLEVKLDTLNNSVKELVDVEEEIVRTELEIELMDKKKTAINIAKEVILKISEDIHNEFAPRINKDVSQLISMITDGKYTNVRIDENLGITVENPQSKEIVPLNNLSGGTIDQMYFALRFSLINSIKEEKLPLILDDCFIQYDDNRLKNILKFLHEVSKDAQILLFTCQNREMEVLDDLNLKYNLIKIS